MKTQRMIDEKVAAIRREAHRFNTMAQDAKDDGRKSHVAGYLRRSRVATERASRIEVLSASGKTEEALVA